MKKVLHTSIKLATPASVVGGFVSDVLTPLAPFSKYLFYFSGICSIVFLALYIQEKKRFNKENNLEETFVFKGLSISVTSFLVFAFMFFLNSKEPQQGFFGANVEAIGNLQKSLSLVEESVNRIEGKVDNIDKKLDVRFDNLEAILKDSSPIKNPESPQEFLANAKIHASTGDYLKAKEAYKKYFEFGLEYIEPHVEYQSLLKNTDGLNSAKVEYEVLAKEKDTGFYNYLSALLEDNYDIREKMINNIIAKYPDFAPAKIELFRMIIEDGQKNWRDVSKFPTKQEYLDLEKMRNEAFESGNYDKYFIDKTKARNVLTEIQESWFESFKDQP